MSTHARSLAVCLLAIASAAVIPAAFAQMPNTAAANTEQNARQHAISADALLEKDNVAGAVAEYREALRLNPKNALARLNLGMAYYNLKQTKAARAEWTRVTQMGDEKMTDKAEADLDQYPE